MTKNSVSLKFSSDIGQQLRQFVTAVQDKAVRPAAYAAARILYDEMQLRVPFKEGVLRRALYHWHDDKQSTNARHVYQIGVNMRKAPHWHLLEYGHMRTHKTYKTKDGQWFTLKDQPLDTPVQVPAQPYIRPSFDAKIAEALDAAKKRMGEKIKELMT